MSRLRKLFEEKKSRVLNVYCTAGYPKIDSLFEVMEALQENGADMIEVGMPYSDPLADGPVIQASSSQALENGMTLPVLFDQLKMLKKRINIPVILMGYMNPVLQFGFERFCREAAAAGVDGLILPDLPEYEYVSYYEDILRKYKLDFIFLITPETSEARVRKLDQLSSGFLYAVSASSTTGSAKNVTGLEPYLLQLKGYGLKNPVLVGFGIKDKSGFDAVCMNATGAIVGSAFIQAISNGEDIKNATKEFLEGLTGNTGTLSN